VLFDRKYIRLDNVHEREIKDRESELAEAAFRLESAEDLKSKGMKDLKVEFSTYRFLREEKQLG